MMQYLSLVRLGLLPLGPALPARTRWRCRRRGALLLLLPPPAAAARLGRRRRRRGLLLFLLLVGGGRRGYLGAPPPPRRQLLHVGPVLPGQPGVLDASGDDHVLVLARLDHRRSLREVLVSMEKNSHCDIHICRRIIPVPA